MCILDFVCYRQCSSTGRRSNQILSHHKLYMTELAETYCDITESIWQSTPTNSTVILPLQYTMQLFSTHIHRLGLTKYKQLHLQICMENKQDTAESTAKLARRHLLPPGKCCWTVHSCDILVAELCPCMLNNGSLRYCRAHAATSTRVTVVEGDEFQKVLRTMTV